MADNCWVCTVEMHARRGAEITWIYPEEDASATRRAVFEAELPFACLGEASSSRARDVRAAFTPRGRAPERRPWRREAALDEPRQPGQ